MVLLVYIALQKTLFVFKHTPAVHMLNATGNESIAALTSFDAAYVIVGSVTCLCSMIGCAIIIICYIMYADIRTPGRRLFLYLTCANLIQNLAVFLQACYS